jgi:hypothetical protein
MTNEEYYITYQLGYWKKTLHWNKCHGGEIAKTGCEKDIPPGEAFIKTGLHDVDGVSFYLCHDCAKKEV